MNKCTVAISGATVGKTLFQEVVEKLGYHIRGADCGLELQEIISRLGWEGDKTEQYYNFYNEIFKLANTTFDFKRKYILRTVQDFWNDNKSQILVLRGSDELEKDLEEEIGIFSIFIARNKTEYDENLIKYDKVILIDQDFEENVKHTLNILTKEKVKV